MLYTQEQARKILNVSTGMFRHWRESIPYLAERSGRSARFTFSDLIVLGVMLDAADNLGVRIASVSTGFQNLFVAAKSISWNEFTEHHAVINQGKGYFVQSDDYQTLTEQNPCILLPCKPTIERLHEELLLSPQQKQLPLPPTALGGDRRA